MSKELEKIIADPDVAAKLDMAVEHPSSKEAQEIVHNFSSLVEVVGT